MSKTPPTVLITTSGVGSPLGELTQYTNKSLVKVGRKPTISYLIELYPKNAEFVVTVGHFGEHVKEFLSLTYPERSIRFVQVKQYEGKGSSLVHSMLAAKKYLQKPFIYHASDTIVTEKVPLPTKNWIGGYKGKGSSQYASFNVVNGRVQQMHAKGELEPDYLHIGLLGIYNYAAFWKKATLLKKQQPNNVSLSDVDVIRGLLEAGIVFVPKEFSTWHDVGNVESLTKARNLIHDSFHILDKFGESIFLFPKAVTKFFADEGVVAKRVKRTNFLKGLIPPFLGAQKHFYSYQYVAGDLLAEVAHPQDVERLLAWAAQKLWLPVQEVSNKKFQEICRDFYEHKTLKRTKEFLSSRGIKDTSTIINGQAVPTLKKLLSQIDFASLSKAEQTYFHGDFILDNILKTKKGFCLLDWRQDFGGLLAAGDMYYDLAKLNHNLTVNHGVVNRELFTVSIKDNVVECDIMRPDRLVACQKALFEFVATQGYDARKVKILTAIVWLNMSPLHHHPFDLFLYYFGKYALFQALEENS